MAEFFFRYGVMNSSKTANLLMELHNLESQGRRVICLKSSLDTRLLSSNNKRGQIESRAFATGHDCEMVSPSENLYQLVYQLNNEILMKYSVGAVSVFVDEAQFLTKEQVGQLADVVEKLNIDVYCFGLKNSYVKGELFEGSSALLYYATDIQEIRTACKYCQKKATMNLRIINGKAVYSGDKIQVGDVGEGTETYAQVCYHHYIYPPAPIEGMYFKKVRKSSLSYKEMFSHILKCANENGYYYKKSDVLKDNNYTFSGVFNPTNSDDFSKLAYIGFGPLLINVKEFALSYNTEKKNGLGSRVNSRIITEILISFLYTFFENDRNMAFNILKSSQMGSIEFFETEDEYLKSRSSRTGDSLKRYETLPDGRYYFYKYSQRSVGWSFWEKVMAGISRYLNNEEIGFYFNE